MGKKYHTLALGLFLLIPLAAVLGSRLMNAINPELRRTTHTTSETSGCLPWGKAWSAWQRC
ncbi:MAG: hypothetical protein WDM77_05870 [Steroidobacteraceae bacterium]